MYQSSLSSRVLSTVFTLIILSTSFSLDFVHRLHCLHHLDSDHFLDSLFSLDLDHRPNHLHRLDFSTVLTLSIILTSFILTHLFNIIILFIIFTFTHIFIFFPGSFDTSHIHNLQFTLGRFTNILLGSSPLLSAEAHHYFHSTFTLVSLSQYPHLIYPEALRAILTCTRLKRVLHLKDFETELGGLQPELILG